MSGLIIKLIISPLALYVSNVLSDYVLFQDINQIILLGLILSGVYHIWERMLLKKDTLWLSTVLDFATAFIIIYASQFLLPGMEITLFGALLTSILLGISEYFQHIYLIKKDQIKDF